MSPSKAGALMLRPRVLLAWVLPATILLVLWGALARGQVGTIALVQHTAKDAGTVTSSPLAFAANNTAGNWIGVAIRAWKAGPTLTVTDTRGNTYRMAMRFNETVDGMTLAVFYAENIAGGSNTVTVSGIQSSGTLRFAILEYSGVATANSLDVTASAQGTSAAPTTSTATTTASGDLVLGLLSTANVRTFTAGSGYVIQDRVLAAPNTKFVVEDRVQTAAGPVSANGTLNTSDIWGTALAAFRPAVGGGGAGPSITGLNPTLGMTATSVTITGTNFGATKGTSTVTFNGTEAAPVSWGATSIVTPVPSGATTGPVVVRVNGVASNGVPFTVDNQAPTGSVVINGGAAATNSTSATLTLSAVDNAQPVTQMRLSNTGTSFSAAEAYATTKAWTLTTGAGTKTVYVQFKDTIGNWSGSFTDSITLDTAAPAISGVSSSNLGNTSATISWTTNEPATSQVEYGTTTSYGTLTALDATLATSHSVVITGLASQTLYNYRVRSRDAAGNEGLGSNGTFTTLSAGTGGVFQNEVLISGMNLPTAVKFLPNGDMLILELGGKIWRVPAGTTQVSATPFLSLTNVGSINGQQGLMDLVLDPGFSTNRNYYIFYTRGSPNNDRVSKFTATADYLGTVTGSEVVLYQDPQSAHAEHHGGSLNFGNDGKLYITTGEHFDPSVAQLLNSPRGKILRINSDGTIPTDNPFYDGTGPNRDDVWARGLRNPFRASYDSLSGKLYFGDVGGNDFSTAQEEVNLGVAGANYGWPNCEGSCSNPAYRNPIYSYPHNGRDAAITGGFIYRGSQFPAQYYGNYFFADYTQNWIRRLTFDANGTVNGVFNFEPISGAPDGPYGDIVYLTAGPDGSLYYVDLGYSDTTGQSGISKIRRIRFLPGNLPPTAIVSATPTQGATPLTVNFSSAGSADPEGASLSYLWTFGDSTTSTQANPVHTYSQRGQYTVQLTVSDGVIVTRSADLLIAAGNRPVATVQGPADGFLFRGGDAILVSGDAADAEDGPLQASAFTWTVDFLHAGHVHPGLPTVGTKSFTFNIPSSGHDFSGDTRYRIMLTVIDSDGLEASQFVTIYPDKVNLSFTSVPSGLVIHLDGLPHTTPFVYDTLINFNHTIEARNQNVGQNAYTFTSWSDGGAQQHTLTVPSAGGTYSATYNAGAVPFPTGLVAGYRLDEGGTSTTTADISGNNITGTLVSGPTWTTGKYTNALSFAGTSYVNLGNPVALRMTGSMTLSAWVNISANPWDDGAIVGKLGANGWLLKTSPDTGVRTAAIQISSSSTSAIQRYSTTVLATNTWYHIAGVYDAAARTLNIYVNGVLDNGVLSGTVPAAQVDGGVNANIAQRTGMPATFNFQGRIDEVHIFNRALSTSEIQTDMNVPR